MSRVRSGVSPEAATEAPLSIMMIASEAVPFAKTGGLADVTAGLSAALGRAGHRVTMVLPRYREVGRVGTSRGRRTVTLGGRARSVELFEVRSAERVSSVLVDCPALYDREGLYGVGGHDHPDNAERFGVLVRTALDLAAEGADAPAVIHAHDWQTGLAPVYLKTRHADRSRLNRTASVFTVHNMGYQGLFVPNTLASLDLDESLYTSGSLAHRNKLSLLKGGIVYSDAVTTVSRQYAREVLTPTFGRGLEGALTDRGADLVGILNGIDTDTWNPESDPWLPTPYSAARLEGKRDAKRAVLARYGLPTEAAALDRPLIGMVTRLVPQKGLDLVADIADELPRLGASFVVLGTGLPQFERLWQDLAAQHPDVIGVRIGFDEELAHLIEGGADLFLMPSRFEPCGLNQLYSLRYGTVPVVRATGGLRDTVDAYDPQTRRGSGFSFSEYSGSALLGALRAALAAFQDRVVWQRLQAAGMPQDHSWDVSAREYVKVYRRVIRGAAARVQASGREPGLPLA